MGGQKFEYDESGSRFFYFLVSFLALVLIPSTYYYWPSGKKGDPEKESKACKCDGCQKKKIVLETSQPYKNVKKNIIRLFIVLGWLLLILLAYKVSQFDYEMSNFDPYEILGIQPGASQADIKRSYRKLSLILHPDKETGNEKAFMKLTKAYQALTDEEAKMNWEKYGNPDGPGAMSFGIALPSWIVEKEYSIWVLGLYGLVFMVALPTAVGTWWYRSIKFSGDQVLLNTSQLYLYFFHKTALVPLKRVIMIFAASCEFDRRHNKEIIERASDNTEVPALFKTLPNLNENNKEEPLCRTYSLKARALIHAHLARHPLNPLTLEKDRQLVVRKGPYLIVEMVNCVSQLTVLAYAGRIPTLPKIETIENCMKLSAMLVQGLKEFKSPLLQLPHITEDNLKFFSSRKKPIQSLQQMAQLTDEERRSILRFLSDEQYDDMIKVLSNMPFITMTYEKEVIDDDDEDSKIVTAGAIVTVTVFLERQPMKEIFGKSNIKEHQELKESEDIGEDGDKTVEGDKVQKKEEKKKLWQKQQKKSTTNKKSKGKAASKKQQPKDTKGSQSATTIELDAKPQPSPTPGSQANGLTKKAKVEKHSDDSDSSDESDVEIKEEGTEGSRRESEVEDNDKPSDDDDEDNWNKIKLPSRERLEGKSKASHTVHCPYYPEEKQEYWWIYICDRKSHTLLTAPCHITNLVDRQEIQLRFTAPKWAKKYVLHVCLQSDSFVGMSQQKEIPLEVFEAKAIPTDHPQWDISDSEKEQQAEDGNESEFATDDEIDDDE